MRLVLLPMLIIVVINLLVDFYIFKAIKESVKNKRARQAHACFSGFLLVFIAVIIALPKRDGSNGSLVNIMWMLFTYLSIYVPKYIFIIIDAIGKAPKIFKRKAFPHFRISALFLAIITFIALWHGALHTAKSLFVKDVTIESAKIPQEFDGYKIAVFADLHLGTYGNDTTFVAKIVDRINKLQPDAIIFAGDLVNRQTSEMLPHIPVLKRLYAKHGIYSVLGNHDYGDYKNWDSRNAKEENNNEFMANQKNMGWNLLNNQSLYLHEGNDSIAIIGVENWGDPPFPKYGNLTKAYSKSNDDVFKILISHNPCHWDAEVIPNTNIDLTISGHTHAMQFEIDIFGKRFSPACFRYKEWGGLYQKDSQYLYVNIGLGEVALPMRVGATPEITLITLKQK